MRAYLALFGARFRTVLQYRTAALAGFATQLFWGLIRIMIFDAFYRSTTSPQPMDLDQVMTYVWLGQCLFATLPQWLDPETLDSIRSGSVANEMLRPIKLYDLWFARNIASRTAPVVLRAAPMVVLALLFFGMRLPVSVEAALAFLVAMFAAILLSASLCTLMATSLLWTVSGEGTMHLISVSAWIFSGIVIPLPFFPDWFQPVINILPFRGLMDVPFRIWTGHISPTAAILHILSVLAWAGAIHALGRWILARGVRKLVVQGG